MFKDQQLRSENIRLPVAHSFAAAEAQKPARGRPAPNGKAIIRQLGLKVTDQRIQILEIVRNGPAHFTAQDIFERVTDKAPGIGFATVYRFLRHLTEHEFVTEIRMGGMPARYEWAGKVHHDHLTCTKCQRIVEFENHEIERLQLEVARQLGFALTNHVLELYGVCAACQNK